MILILMGVSGCGKTTIGKLLAAKTGFPFFDGDDFHPTDNIRKMSAGIPLTDDDRYGWIDAIAEHFNKHPNRDAILACSALSMAIRQRLAQKLTDNHQFVFLQGDERLISKRLQARAGHFMKADMLRSQFDALQLPDKQALYVDIAKTPEEIIQEILSAIQL